MLRGGHGPAQGGPRDRLDGPGADPGVAALGEAEQFGGCQARHATGGGGVPGDSGGEQDEVDGVTACRQRGQRGPGRGHPRRGEVRGDQDRQRGPAQAGRDQTGAEDREFCVVQLRGHRKLRGHPARADGRVGVPLRGGGSWRSGAGGLRVVETVGEVLQVPLDGVEHRPQLLHGCGHGGVDRRCGAVVDDVDGLPRVLGDAHPGGVHLPAHRGLEHELGVPDVLAAGLFVVAPAARRSRRGERQQGVQRRGAQRPGLAGVDVHLVEAARRQRRGQPHQVDRLAGGDQPGHRGVDRPVHGVQEVVGLQPVHHVAQSPRIPQHRTQHRGRREVGHGRVRVAGVRAAGVRAATHGTGAHGTGAHGAGPHRGRGLVAAAAAARRAARRSYAAAWSGGATTYLASCLLVWLASVCSLRVCSPRGCSRPVLRR